MTTSALTEQASLVLTALAAQPLHGYGIVGEVERLTEGRTRLAVATLYGQLERLAGDGLVELDREEAHAGRLRRYYRLTERGGQALSAHAAQQQAYARLATRRLRAWSPAPKGGAA